MNTHCSFDPAAFSFVGSPLEQARCLLRFVKRGGDVVDQPATLPDPLTDLLASPQTLNLTTTQLRAYLQSKQILESTVGGSLDNPVSRARENNPGARLAQYFMIHDTSSKLSAGQTFDPSLINAAQWSGNRLATLAPGRTHIYITRLGETKTDKEYDTPWRATQFELADKNFQGYFLPH